MANRRTFFEVAGNIPFYLGDHIAGLGWCYFVGLAYCFFRHAVQIGLDNIEALLVELIQRLFKLLPYRLASLFNDDLLEQVL